MLAHDFRGVGSDERVGTRLHRPHVGADRTDLEPIRPTGPRAGLSDPFGPHGRRGARGGIGPTAAARRTGSASRVSHNTIAASASARAGRRSDRPGRSQAESPTHFTGRYHLGCHCGPCEIGSRSRPARRGENPRLGVNNNRAAGCLVKGPVGRRRRGPSGQEVPGVRNLSASDPFSVLRRHRANRRAADAQPTHRYAIARGTLDRTHSQGPNRDAGPIRRTIFT